MDVWVFHGAGGHYSSGVFSCRSLAEQWIRMRGLTGILTKYPLDSGVYDWALDNQIFYCKK